MSELPQPPPPQFDPELEAAIRRNVAVYWNPEADYEDRLQAQAALQGLAAEGFRELLHVVDMLRSDFATRVSTISGDWEFRPASPKHIIPIVQAPTPFPEGFWDGLGKGKGSS
jgi:hypothetical protein